MPWVPQSVNDPAQQVVSSVLTPFSNALGAISPILSTASALLDVARVFITGTADPLQNALDEAIADLEDLINDTFGSGMFTLTVNPFRLEGIRKFDDFGTPLMTPADIIDEMVDSFDDLGDANRPQFSDSAQVVAFGLIATAPDLAGLLDLMKQLVDIFSIPEWELVLLQHERQADDAFVKSKLPDWESLRLNSFAPFDSVQRSMIGLLEAAKGTKIVADDNILDLINLIDAKVNKLQQLTEDIREIVDQAAGSATGLFVFDLDLTSGGNAKIQEELRDPFLEQCVPNGYSIGTLFVGGGLSAPLVQSLKTLMLG